MPPFKEDHQADNQDNNRNAHGEDAQTHNQGGGIGEGDSVSFQGLGGCKACLQVGCPALSHRPNEKNGRTAAVIDPTQCVGCEVCAQACRFGAISKA